MPADFWKIVNEVIEESDILLEILDARMIKDTRNSEIEAKVKEQNKILIFVINKCDLADQEELKKIRLAPSVYVSSIKRYGITKLLHLILRYAPKKEKVVVGVLGYPNTGKSSVINALKGRGSAPTAPISGYTKAKQLIKVTSQIYLMDTPGVYPYMENDSAKHAMTSSLDSSKIKDPEGTVIDLMRKFKGKIEAFYGVDVSRDKEESLEQIAIKNNRLMKGGIADTKTMAVMILQAWQKGKIKL